MSKFVLVQFPISHFCLKVRMIMDLKSVAYTTKTVYPLLQGEVKRISGQQKVPVLLVDDRPITDSTDIANYLEERFATPSLYPEDSHERRMVQLWEDWADESLSFIVRDVFYGRLKEFPELLDNVLPKSARGMLPDPALWLGSQIVTGVFTRKLKITQQQIDRAYVRLGPALTMIKGELKDKPYLVGNRLTLADIAVAAGLDPIRPVRMPGDADYWDPLFEWADGIRRECSRARLQRA